MSIKSIIRDLSGAAGEAYGSGLKEVVLFAGLLVLFLIVIWKRS